jgi:hypothetical protein
MSLGQGRTVLFVLTHEASRLAPTSRPFNFTPLKNVPPALTVTVPTVAGATEVQEPSEFLWNAEQRMETSADGTLALERELLLITTPVEVIKASDKKTIGGVHRLVK